MAHERTVRQVNINGTSDMNPRHLMGLTRRGEPAPQKCGITGSQKKILGRVSNHRVSPFRAPEKNLA